MSTVALSHRAIRRKTISLDAIKINWKLIYFLAVLFSSVMLILYIFRVNQLTQGAFLIKNYNNQMQTLLAENRTLQANFAQTRFLGRAIDKAKELSFEKTANVTYIQILQSPLAEAK